MEPQAEIKNFAGEDALASKVKRISKGQKITWVRATASYGAPVFVYCVCGLALSAHCLDASVLFSAT